MKKPIALVALLCTLSMGAHADLILHEDFDRTVGTLNQGLVSDMGTNTNDWWHNTGGADSIKVVAGSLKYTDYVESNGNKAMILGGAVSTDLRQFAPISSGKVYAAAIINVDSVASAVSSGVFLSLGDAETGTYAKLHCYQSGEGFKLAVSKSTEGSNEIDYTSDVYKTKTDYFVVIEYQFVDGDMNDSVRLYVNPVKDAPTATIECAYSKTYRQGRNPVIGGANTKADATQIASVDLSQTASSAVGRIYVDEIKVATVWDDLFESDYTPTPTVTPEILVDNTITFSKGTIYTGTEYSANFYLYADNLTDSVKLTCNNADVSLSKTALSKEEAEAGIDITATLNTATAGNGEVTITVSSTGAENVTVTSSWTAVQLNKVSTIAALKEGTAADATGMFLYTGEAIITYSEPDNYYTKYYLEDASGAVRIDDWYCSNTYKVGDKVKDVYAIYGDGEDLNGQVPLSLAFNVITVVSSDNEPTPQVVTLEQLQANAADYLLELVKVEGVSLSQTSTTFSTGNSTITQNGTSGAIGLTSDNTLVGTTKPKKANIIGLSYNKSGYNIRIRTAADLTPIEDTTPTALDAIEDNVNNENNFEIYTVSGQRVNTLQPGVNIIRQGEKTYKVIR